MTILADWDEWYPGCPPVGHRLRDAFAARWVRFHSLPESKRYPGDETEYDEVVRRHNAVLSELTRVDRAVVLVTTVCSPSAAPPAPGLDGEPWRAVAKHATDADFADPTYWHLSAGRHTWRPGLFDAVVRQVAGGDMANVLVVAAAGRWVLYPYDGGMDVIAASAADRDRLAAVLGPWRSPRADGL